MEHTSSISTVDPAAAPATRDRLSQILLAVAVVGIWVLVLQNMGVLSGSQQVEVTNRVRVSGDVGVSGYVDANISAINGHSNVFYNDGPGSTRYYRLPVSD